VSAGRDEEVTTMAEGSSTVRVAMIGYAFMGAAHSQAWRNVHRFFDLGVTPEMAVVVGRDGVKAPRQPSGWAGSPRPPTGAR